ncbi:hypothetical protein Agub_g442, partial [Astrephomene gubernaculifera]
YPYGLFYGGGGKLIACQVIGVLAIGAWTLGLMFPFFWIFKRFNLLRVPADEELSGLDISRHCSRAYYIDQYNTGAPATGEATYPISYDNTYSNPAYSISVKPANKNNGDRGAVGDAIMRA